MKQVKVAVIDSGVEYNHPSLSLRNISGIEISQSENSYSYKNNIFDANGHGTAIAGIIFDKCPEIEMISIKILDHNLKSTFSLLVEALRFAMSCEVDIINLSLGTIKEEHKIEFEKLCNELVSRGILMVAAFNNNNVFSYPAVFSEVFGVKSGFVPFKYGFGFEEDSLTVLANGSRQKVCSLKNAYEFRSGNSYACAHFTGILANIVFTQERKDRGFVIEYLKQRFIPHSDLKSLEKFNPFLQIKRGLLFPLSKESLDFISTNSGDELTITGLYDFRSFYFNHFDVSTKDGLRRVELFHRLEVGLENADTLLIGDISFIPEGEKEKLIYNLVAKTIALGRNVLSKEALPPIVYTDLYGNALQRGLFIYSKYI